MMRDTIESAGEIERDDVIWVFVVGAVCDVSLGAQEIDHCRASSSEAVLSLAQWLTHL